MHIATKLNRSHLVHGEKALILPTLGRTEFDVQNGIAQGVTVEDSTSMVHISYGMNKPASPNLMSEPAIVANIAHATLGDEKVDWLGYASDYAKVRDAIELTIEGFARPVRRRDAALRPVVRGACDQPVPLHSAR